MPIHKNGFSLVEMLIALAVSAIIIAAAFGSYAMIARNFDFQKDMKYIAQSARAVVDMVNSDIRLAGYTAVDNGAIANAVMLSDSGTAACCDAISVVYDQTPTERRQVTYYTKQYTSDVTRFRLYKHICMISTSYTIAQIQAGQCPATATLLAENPIADYVEDLQFIGSRGDCVTGSTELGCGTVKEIIPATAFGDGCHSEAMHLSVGGLSGDASNSIDSNSKSFTLCNNNALKWNFSNDVRINKVVLSHAPESLNPGFSNGGGGPNPPTTVHTSPLPAHCLGSSNPCWLDFALWKYPFGINTTVTGGNHTFWIDTDLCTGWDHYPECLPSANGDPFPSGNPTGHFDAGFVYGTDQEILFPPKMYQSLINEVRFKLRGPSYGAEYNGSCNSQTYNSSCVGTFATGLKQVSFTLNRIRFYGEVYGGAITPHEIETSILIRSPNEHGNVNRSVGSPLTLGNRTNTWSDKHLRDSFTTATVVRNLYYSSQ